MKSNKRSSKGSSGRRKALLVRARQVSSSLEERIRRVDPFDLKSDFNNWPLLAKRSWESVDPPRLYGEPSSIVIAGLGGSGIVGELIADIAAEKQSTKKVFVLKDYHLPAYVDDSTIVVGVSCSGNTEETLSVLNEARLRGLKGFNFGSGGELEHFSSKYSDFPFTKTLSLKVPRSSLPALFYPVLKFFKNNGLLRIDEGEVLESFESLGKVQENCISSNYPRENKSLGIAGNIVKSTVPLVYSSKRTRAVGMRFRQSLNENAKMHAFDGIVPELCHNDIVGWDENATSGKRPLKKPTSFPALLALEDDAEEVRTRFQIIKEIIERNRGEYFEAPYVGRSFLARAISMLYWLDYSTYYAAILKGIDPIKTPSIDYLKGELKTRLDYLDKFKN